MAGEHDHLQYECHTWLWNTYPQYRMLGHANFNNLTSEAKSPEESRRQMAKLKSIGLVKGVLDYEFLFKGQIYYFDFKIGEDKLSNAQKDFIYAIERQGGRWFEIRSLEQFKQIIDGIVNQ